VLALLTNGGVALMLYRFRGGDANMRSVWICSRNDAIGNLAVLLAAAGVFGTGTGWPDLVVATIMAGLGIGGIAVALAEGLAASFDAGDVLIGPSALLAPARDAYRLSRWRLRDLAETLSWPGVWRMAARHRRAAAIEVRHALSRRAFVAEAARMVPALRGARAAAGPAGIRAQALRRDGTLEDDFVVHRTERAIHVRNAPSPAATSSPALAALVADELEATMTIS